MKAKLLLCALILSGLTSVARAQLAYDVNKFAIFDGQGRQATIEQVLNAIGESDAVFLGEQHDDGVAHAVQAEIFRRVVERYGKDRRIGLSLEMFERDVQMVIAEYLTGLITENHFLLSSRPWPNYKTDYRPLVELAREKKLPVIAANAPRRYINMVSRNGRTALNGLNKDARKWLPPLPFAEPSAAYSTKFKALMANAPEARNGIDNILASQALWDAAMADAVATFLKKDKKGLVIHLNGSFHTESRLGTVEHLLKYRPKAKPLVITMRKEADFAKFDPAKHQGLGDFVILTSPPVAGRSPLSEILRRMDQHRATLRSLRANATLMERNAQLGVTDISEGALSLLMRQGSQSDYLRFDWTRTKDALVVIGKDYQYYKPRINQLYYGTLATRKNASGTQLLDFTYMSAAELGKVYDLTYKGEEQVGETRAWRIQAKPKFDGDRRLLDIWVDGDGMPIKFLLTHPNNDTASLTLYSIAKNVAMQYQIFRLVTPLNVKRVVSS